MAPQPSPTYTWAVTLDVTGPSNRLHFERFDSEGQEAYCVALEVDGVGLRELEGLLSRLLEVALAYDTAGSPDPF